MTDGLAYLAACALAMVFVYSAGTKLRDVRPTRRALDVAGVPAAKFISRALPIVELAVAVALVVRPAVGAGLALGLLGLFTGFVVYLLVRDLDVSCGCFGASARDSVSAVDLVRNGLLMALAVLAGGVSRPYAPVLEEVLAATTVVAIAVVILRAMATRHELGQLFDNRLPGER